MLLEGTPQRKLPSQNGRRVDILRGRVEEREKKEKKRKDDAETVAYFGTRPRLGGVGRRYPGRGGRL